MRDENEKKKILRERRTWRVRSHLRGSAERPRMCVVKTNKHVYVQLIDDVNSVTLVAAGTGGKASAGTEMAKKSKVSAAMVGELIAKKAKEAGISEVIFDRGPSKYHGILAALAEAARQHGLKC